MNYFEFYPGDYQRDTNDLSLAEHGAYLLLLSAYYSADGSLPESMAALYRICRAMKNSEQMAVKTVANRYFPLGDDGKRFNTRADAEIHKAQKRISAAKANGSKGGRPKAANPLGNPVGIPAGNPDPNPAETQQGTHSGKALQIPDPTITPERSLHAERSLSPASHEPRALSPTAAGEACMACRRGGLMQTNPSHPSLLAAIAEGATPEQFEHTAREAVEQGKGFAWVIATVRGRNVDAARAPPPRANQPHTTGPTSKVGQAIATLEAMKSHGNPEHHEPDGLDLRRDPAGPAATFLPGPRSAARR